MVYTDAEEKNAKSISATCNSGENNSLEKQASEKQLQSEQCEYVISRNTYDERSCSTTSPDDDDLKSNPSCVDDTDDETEVDSDLNDIVESDFKFDVTCKDEIELVQSDNDIDLYSEEEGEGEDFYIPSQSYVNDTATSSPTKLGKHRSKRKKKR